MSALPKGSDPLRRRRRLRKPRRQWSSSSDEGHEHSDASEASRTSFEWRSARSLPSTPTRAPQEHPLLRRTLQRRSFRRAQPAALPQDALESELMAAFPTFHSISVASGSPVGVRSMGMLLDLIQELETDLGAVSSDACCGSAELLAPQPHRRTMTMPTSMSQSCETFLATREGVCLNVARRPHSRSVDHVDRSSLVWRDTGIADFFRDLTDIFERTLRQKKGLDPDCALPEPAVRRRRGRRGGGWEAGQRNTLHDIQYLLPPTARAPPACLSSPDLVSAFALSDLNPFGSEPELDDLAPPFGLALGERGEGEAAAAKGASEGHRWSLQELEGPASAEVLPPGLVWQTVSRAREIGPKAGCCWERDALFRRVAFRPSAAVCRDGWPSPRAGFPSDSARVRKPPSGPRGARPHGSSATVLR
ncbi:hypothetical protein C7M84_019906 [Penaeus vannamei]|uniref:Uncharacterized protein n=1 Tax=Penaeus vannamei TaxID=6689 RepID=A0A423SDJ1_PENVA|nr:hypothetical protein C7M84_019906 [Penaeus vannamei]